MHPIPIFHRNFVLCGHHNGRTRRKKNPKNGKIRIHELIVPKKVQKHHTKGNIMLSLGIIHLYATPLEELKSAVVPVSVTTGTKLIWKMWHVFSSIHLIWLATYKCHFGRSGLELVLHNTCIPKEIDRETKAKLLRNMGAGERLASRKQLHKPVKTTELISKCTFSPPVPSPLSPLGLL